MPANELRAARAWTCAECYEKTVGEGWDVQSVTKKQWRKAGTYIIDVGRHLFAAAFGHGGYNVSDEEGLDLGAGLMLSFGCNFRGGTMKTTAPKAEATAPSAIIGRSCSAKWRRSRVEAKKESLESAWAGRAVYRSNDWCDLTKSRPRIAMHVVAMKRNTLM